MAPSIHSKTSKSSTKISTEDNTNTKEIPSPSHHIGSPPTSFRNPWPSFTQHTPWEILQARFSKNRNFVPVPTTRDELVSVRKPDWGMGTGTTGKEGMKVTWIGHASFFVESSKRGEGRRERGVRVLFDPLWSERTSPVQWVGPKRYTPVPCTLQEVPDVDLVLISHNHYDHMDSYALKELYRMREGNVRFICPLGNAAFFHSLGIKPSQVFEFDWWHGDVFEVPGVGSVRLTCTPSQHASGRAIWDQGSALWCSWVLEEVEAESEPGRAVKKLFFAGDTGYRSVPLDYPPDAPEDSLPFCPAFKEIGEKFGPFDLALLPIGLYSPRKMLSSVHCNAEDSVNIHFDIRSKRSIGMHWGTIRGGISGQYEDVREPPRKWKEAVEEKGLTWGVEAGLLDVGETLVIE